MLTDLLREEHSPDNLNSGKYYTRMMINDIITFVRDMVYRADNKGWEKGYDEGRIDGSTESDY